MLSSRGTNVPVDPRTCRTIGPRLTVSGQIVERSTVGAAGFSRDSPTSATANPATTTPARIQRLRFIFCNKSGRAISMPRL